MDQNDDAGGDEAYDLTMQRFTRDEATIHDAELRKWNSLSDVDMIMGAVARKAQLYAVSQGALKFWREAFVGMSCARLTHAVRFRLGGDPPDFELDYGDHQRSFEIVNVMPEGWLLGKEYDGHAERLNAGQPVTLRSLSFEQGRAEYDAFGTDLQEQIAAKMGKNYPAGMILVADVLHEVDFNIDTGLKHVAAQRARKGLEKFDEVWVRRATYILRVTRHGVTQISNPWPTDA
jgi:hypothetical protein